MSEPNPVTGEQAWKHPPLEQMGREPAPGSQCWVSLLLLWNPGGTQALLGTHGQPFLQQEGCRHMPTLDLMCICLFAGATVMPTQTPCTFAVYVPSYLLHCLPQTSRREKLPCQQNTFAFTNSILNEEEMTEGNISGSLKMRVKRETFFHLSMKLNWYGLMYHGIYRWLSHVLKRDVDFSDQKVKSFYYQTSTNGGYFLQFPLKTFQFALLESLYLAQLALNLRSKAVLHFWKLLSQAKIGQWDGQWSMVNEMLNLSSR